MSGGERPGAAEASPESLRLTIIEDQTHARHAQDLRERQFYRLAIPWIAVLAYASSKRQPLEKSPELFFLLGGFTLVALLTSLKWTAEFGNHE